MKKQVLIILLLSFCLAYSSGYAYGQSKAHEIGVRLETKENITLTLGYTFPKTKQEKKKR